MRDRLPGTHYREESAALSLTNFYPEKKKKRRKKYQFRFDNIITCQGKAVAVVVVVAPSFKLTLS